MTKSNLNKKYEKLKKENKILKSELENIKTSNLYYIVQRLPLFLKKWLLDKKDYANKKKTKLDLNDEIIDFEKGKVDIFINTINLKYDISKILNELINQTYINCNIILLCNDDKYDIYYNIDERISIYKFEKYSSNFKISDILNEIYKSKKGEFFLYINNILEFKSNFLKKSINLLNNKIDLIILYSKQSINEYAFMMKKEKVKCIKKYVDNMVDINELRQYRNVLVINGGI